METSLVSDKIRNQLLERKSTLEHQNVFGHGGTMHMYALYCPPKNPNDFSKFLKLIYVCILIYTQILCIKKLEQKVK